MLNIKISILAIVLGALCFATILSYKSFANTKESDEVLVFVITNIKKKGHFGDRSQSIGIKNSLTKMLNKNGFEVEEKEIDMHDIAALKSEIKKTASHSLVISAGDYGIDSLRMLKEDKGISSKIMTIWSGHQEFQHLKDAMSFLNIVVLPEYLITGSLKMLAWSKNSDLIGVDFIPHSLNLKQLKFAYEDFKEKNQIPLGKPYTIILFGGDAPDASGNVLRIKDREINNMAGKVSEIVKSNRSTLVIANSYRTTDAQIKLFLDNLNNYGIKDYVFFDFHKQSKSYKPLLYLISLGNASIVTGDSVSMIDEAIQFAKKPVYVEEVSSMNKNHLKHLSFLQEHQYAMLLSEYNEANLNYKKPSVASKIVVKQIKDKILAFLNKSS